MSDEPEHVRGKNERRLRKKRMQLLEELGRELDATVYAQLSIIYYLDCSFFRFILRALVQFSYLTPKPGLVPEPPTDRPFLGMIMGTNLLCLLLHVAFPMPTGDSGYLHGGALLDLIGQRPTNKVVLASMDVAVIVLQLCQLTVHLQRLKLKNGGESDSEWRTLNTVDEEAAQTNTYLFDAFNSGQVMLTNLNLMQTIRDQLKL
ncbi:DUF1746-domain-containing protein [Piedraia hortae CBS 480.64]|uniref:DUF1746-domain-containing protein n=1 Tax=Piedraia hortae CBS 480.64 TaxID=1314780 RepID=A0A6A7BUF8_9PEZI|nr:DUF1746-domain-containing protein [Piedraia hortae CBS 480.64]